jgi:uncharacterized integral membrane protein
MFFLKRLALFWFLCSFFGLSGYFAIYNQDRVSVTFPPWIDHLSLPSYMAFVVFFLLGSAVTWVYFGIEYTRKSFEVRRLSRIVRQQDQPAVTSNNMPEVQ